MALQAELVRLIPVVDHRVVHNEIRDRIRGVRDQVIPTYQYLPSYDKDEGMGYVELAEIGAIISPALTPNFKFNITSEII